MRVENHASLNICSQGLVFMLQNRNFARVNPRKKKKLPGPTLGQQHHVISNQYENSAKMNESTRDSTSSQGPNQTSDVRSGGKITKYQHMIPL